MRIRDVPVRGRGSAIVINAAWVPARVLVIAIVDGFIVFNATARTAVAHNEEYAHSQKDVDRVGIHERAVSKTKCNTPSCRVLRCQEFIPI